MVKVRFVDPAGNTIAWDDLGAVPRRDETVAFDDGDVLRVTGVLWHLPGTGMADEAVTLRMGTVGGVM